MKAEELDKYKVKCVISADGKCSSYQSGTGDYLLSQHEEELRDLFSINEDPSEIIVIHHLRKKGIVISDIYLDK